MKMVWSGVLCAALTSADASAVPYTRADLAQAFTLQANLISQYLSRAELNIKDNAFGDLQTAVNTWKFTVEVNPTPRVKQIDALLKKAVFYYQSNRPRALSTINRAQYAISLGIHDENSGLLGAQVNDLVDLIRQRCANVPVL